MEIFLQTETWIALATLTFLEIVLGVDNIIFISIVSNKLPEKQQPKARNLGLMLAMGFRILLLLGITWIIQLTDPLFTLPIIHEPISVKDLILIGGGLFLLGKSVTEIHHKLEGGSVGKEEKKGATSFTMVITQIILVDMVFSFDSILTAIGLVKEVLVMIIAVVISMLVMMAFAGAISRFISKHPTLQMLALSFLILIGFMLVVEGLGTHVDKGYIYFAIFFSLIVELLNMRLRKRGEPIELRKRGEG